MNQSLPSPFRTALRWLAGLLLAHLCASAAPAGKRELAIAQKALPVLRDECFACHSPEKKKGGLLLTSRDAILQGGAEGPVAVPGKPDASKLLTSLAKEADPHMPPKKQLADAQVKLLRDWVKAGLPWDDAALSDEGPPPPPVALGELPSGFHPAAPRNTTRVGHPHDNFQKKGAFVTRPCLAIGFGAGHRRGLARVPLDYAAGACLFVS